MHIIIIIFTHDHSGSSNATNYLPTRTNFLKSSRNMSKTQNYTQLTYSPSPPEAQDAGISRETVRTERSSVDIEPRLFIHLSEPLVFPFCTPKNDLLSSILGISSNSVHGDSPSSSVSQEYFASTEESSTVSFLDPDDFLLLPSSKSIDLCASKRERCDNNQERKLFHSCQRSVAHSSGLPSPSRSLLFYERSQFDQDLRALCAEARMGKEHQQLLLPQEKQTSRFNSSENFHHFDPDELRAFDLMKGDSKERRYPAA